MNVGTLCNRNVVTATEDQSLLEAAETMRENHVGDLVVVEAIEGGTKPIGIITDRDLTMALAKSGPDAMAKKTIGQRMTDVVILAREDDSIEEVLSNMRANGVRRVPIVDEGDHLYGILTFDDLVGHFGRQLLNLGGVVQEEIAKEIRGGT
jgi:CBS domain-containing protein